jgi:Zn-dependent protease with chaperone function
MSEHTPSIANAASSGDLLATAAVSADQLYPAGPPGIPTTLARPSVSHRVRVVLLLLALFLFLVSYAALVAAGFYLLLWTVLPPAEAWDRLPEGTGAMIFFVVLRAGLFAASAMFLAFLIKGFFKQSPDVAAAYVEVSEEKQPQLYRFIRALCREIGSPLPVCVYVNHEVNAAVFSPTSAINLVIPPPKHLLIGLGLVNELNLLEFKALLAHEFGHFSQRSLRLTGYARIAYSIIHNIIYVRDRWDNWVIGGFDTPGVSVLAVPLYILAEGTRKLLAGLFRVLAFAHGSLSRQMELNADLVAVSVAGSDALVQLLVKSDLCHDAWQQAGQDLVLAAEHHLFSCDLFFHQRRAAESLRLAGTTTLDPLGGQDPLIPPNVFERESAHTATMWDDHPTHFDREQNARRHYFPSPSENRPAWLLFRGTESICAEVTRRYYQSCLNVEPEETLEPAERVQKFLDEERAALTFEARFQGAYTNRLLELTNLETADTTTEASLTREQMERSLAELYSDKLRVWMVDFRRRLVVQRGFPVDR